MRLLEACVGWIILRSRWLAVGPASLLIFLLINLGLLRARPGLFLQLTSEPLEPAATVVSAVLPTSTAYQPLRPTPTLTAQAPVAAAASPELEPSVLLPNVPVPGLGRPNPGSDQPNLGLGKPNPEPSTEFFGIDFSPGAERIKIIIQPQDKRVNGGKPIVVTVNPGKSCPFQKDRACVNAYRSGEAAGNVILVSVHSGIGGEAEAYRRAVEGMGVDQAGFSLKQIRSNLARLEGATVRIQQGQREVDGLRLAAASRVPPGKIREYFRGSAEQALRLAASVDPRLEGYAQPIGPILVFETCGWKLRGEPWAPGVTSTTGSVYVGVIEAGE